MFVRVLAGFWFFSLLSVPFVALAQVSGVCANCHTMHNSQDGSVVDSNGPSGHLLNTGCVGCHSSSTNVTIKVLGSTRIPIVYNQLEPTYPPDGSVNSTLAGGNFYWVVKDGDAYGHNVYGIAGIDGTLNQAPGTGVGCTNCHATLANAAAENGCRGCHVPRHHADDSAVVVGESGGWYRFLGDNPAMTFGGSAPEGVVGIEEENWEQDPSSTNHNVYQGTTTVYSKSKTNSQHSIGKFCAGCHGDFHHAMNTDQPGDISGAWIRHPSDVVIPNSSEYAGYTEYNPLAPVAVSTTLTAGDADASSLQTVEPGSDVVTCISCHRPHGSPYPDMLRWDYAGGCLAGPAGASDCGCFTCHTAKDD